MTWADICVASCLDNMENYMPGLLNEFPRARGLLDTIRELPEIKQYLSERSSDLAPFEAPFE